MAYRTVHSWTLAGLLLAFVDLAITYVLLCGSAFAFFPSKFLSIFGLYLPCPCNGFLGYQNSDSCFHKLLVDWPTSKIKHVQELARSRFPFDLISFMLQSCDLHVEGFRDRRRENEVIELEVEGCSSSFSGPKLHSSVDGEIQSDAKRTKGLNQKQKSGIRRRRRAALGYGKFPSALSSNSTRSVGLVVPRATYDDWSEMRSQLSGKLGPASGTEDCPLDDANAPNAIDHGKRVHDILEFNGSCDKGKGITSDPSSIVNNAYNVEETLDSAGNNANEIKSLERALEEERASLAALYQELENERAAAATAADEAMAMIMRLQQDKASIEMEARQYQRMIEEKFSYDEEEMSILKEILVRKELENHYLEKELESYQLMNISGDELLEEDSSYKKNNTGQMPSLPLDSNENLSLMPQQIGKSETNSQKEVETKAKCLSNHEVTCMLAFGEEMMPKHKKSASDSSISQGLLQKTVDLARKEKTQRDLSMTSQTCVANGEEQGNDRNHLDQESSDLHSPTADAELTVYDVHVVDDKTTIWKEDGGKESEPLSSVPSDFGVWNMDKISDCPNTSMTAHEPNSHGNRLGMRSRSLELGNSQNKRLGIDLDWSSSSAVYSERLKIDSEVEWLRERLQTVQEEKGKMIFPAEHTERINAQLKLIEEIVNQLCGIHQLREIVQQASLPPLSSKVSLKKRNCRSGSWEAFESA